MNNIYKSKLEAMNVQDIEISINKKDLNITEIFNKSYFDLLKNTNIGNDTCILTVEELLLLSLPQMNICEQIDKYMIEKENILFVLMKCIYSLGYEKKIALLVDDENIKFRFLKFILHQDFTNYYKICSQINIDFCYIASQLDKFNGDELKIVFNILDENKRDILMYFCQNNSDKAIEIINKYGKYFLSNKIDKNGDNALLIACRNNRLEVCNKILEFYGIFSYPDTINKDKRTVLLYACLNKLENFAIKLINEFGDLCVPDIIDLDGDTVLSHSIYLGLNKFSHKFIDMFGNKCRPNNVNKWGSTALIYACQRSVQSIALKLIDKFDFDCVPEQVSQRKNTALSLASRNDMFEVIDKMIDMYGLSCNPSIQDIKGNTSLMYLSFSNVNLTLKLLNNFGKNCNIYATSKSNLTVLGYCIEHDLKEIVDKIYEIERL